jgi:hypothetical protein
VMPWSQCGGGIPCPERRDGDSPGTSSTCSGS